MKVDSTSPDTGQRGGCTLACNLYAQALSGKTVRVLSRVQSFMKNGIFLARRCAVALAVSAAFPVLAQVDSLREVVVTATRFEDSAQALPYGVSVVTQEEIRRSGVSSVPEAIMKLLGVAGKIDLNGGNNFGLDLRGFGETASSNQTIIVDGRRINEADMTMPNLAAIPIDSVQTIEVLRGNAAVLYGEGATGGAIVITTKPGRGVQRPNGATVVGTIGSFGVRDLRTSVNLASGPFSLDIAAQDRKSDGFRENFASSQNSLTSTAQWSNDAMRLGVQAGRTLSRSGLPGPLSLAELDTDASKVGTSGSKTDWAQAKNEHIGVFWSLLLEDWELGADVTQRTRQHDAENFGATAYNVEGTSTNLRAKRQFQGDAFGGAISLGWDANQWTRKNSMAYGFADTSVARSDSDAVYALGELRFKPWGTRVEAGLRNDVVRKSKTGVAVQFDEVQRAWHLGASQALGWGTHAFGRVGQSYRLPNFDEMSTLLQTQISRDTEMGLRWAAAGAGAEIRWYRSALQNEIGFDGANNVNFDPTEHRGVEVEGRVHVSPALTLRANANFRQNVFVDGSNAGKDIYLVPRQSASVLVDYRFNAQHSVVAGVTSVSSQYIDQANTCTVPGYSTADARYSYQRGNLEWSLAVNNLANAKYYTLAYGCPSSTVYPEAGRSVAATLKISL